MKLGLILLTSLLITLTCADTFSSRVLQQSTTTSSAGTMKVLPISADRTSSNIYDFVDNAIKEKYWYYLTKACLLYLSTVDRTDGSYQFLAIYRNLVGTFLAITTWKQGESTFEVNTLVRLGNGLALDHGANYKPVAVKPLTVRYSLGDSEVIIDFTDCDDIKINGRSIASYYDCEGDDCKTKTDDLLIKDCEEFSAFCHEKYWYYLQDSHVVYSSVGKTDARNYCLVTYVNAVGTFFAIGSHDASAAPHSKVNTFVRLGNGFEKGSEASYEAVKFNKVNLRLRDYIEM